MCSLLNQLQTATEIAASKPPAPAPAPLVPVAVVPVVVVPVAVVTVGTITGASVGATVGVQVCVQLRPAEVALLSPQPMQIALVFGQSDCTAESSNIPLKSPPKKSLESPTPLCFFFSFFLCPMLF